MKEETIMKNENLLKAHECWYKQIVEPFLIKYDNEEFSLPFYTGVSSINNERLPCIMIVGQEALNYDKLNEDNLREWPPKKSQEWSIAYLNKQIGVKDIQYDITYNNSPFWLLFRLFYDKRIFPCWNNLDKVHRYIKNDNNQAKTTPLKEEHERVLNQPFFPNANTLLLEEIEIVKPDAIVFVTGPRYKVSMETALNCDLSTVVPNKEEYVRDITEALNIGIKGFWTYHPKYLSHHRKLKDCVELILSHIK